MIKTWISSYLSTQGESENLCFVAVGMSYGHLFTSCRSNHTRSIFFTDSSLYVVKKSDRRKNLPSNGLPYSWKTRWCNSVLHCVCNLQPFL